MKRRLTTSGALISGSLLCAVMLAACGSSPQSKAAPADANKDGAGSAPDAAPAGATPEAEPPDPASPEGRLLAENWTGDLDGVLTRRYLRVLVIPDKINFFFDGVMVRGVTHDAMREFESFLNKKFKRAKAPVSVIFVPVHRDEILKALVDGRGDIAASGLGISPEREKIVDFSDPVRDGIKVIPVGGPGAPPLKSLGDLAGKTVYVPASSVFPGLIADLNRRFKTEGKPAVVVKAADENLDPGDILEMVNADLVPYTLSDSLTTDLWAKVFTGLHPYEDLPLIDTGAMGWAFRKNSPALRKLANEFIKGNREGTAFANTVLRKYLSTTKWVKNATSDADAKKFKEMVALFRKYGDRYSLPYLLVAAQAYQESSLNQNARSPVGAVGVMQIKPETAAGKPIEVKNVDQLEANINAGTKYLKFLIDRYYEDAPMDRVTKGLFAIASYNAGPARIRGLRTKAQKQGLDPNKWFNNVELIAAKDIGRETVQYVSNIYKYYLAYQMLTEKTAARSAAVAAAKKSLKK